MRCSIRHKTGGLTLFFRSLWESFRWNDSKPGYPDAVLMDILDQAQSEWKYAKIYFNNVTDPDLIDHAIFYMGAAEKKYIYLLKRARETGLYIDQFNFNE